MQVIAPQSIQRNNSSAILEKVALGDKTAIKDCIDRYGDMIWSLARKFTHTTDEAEAVTREIFLNIWRYAERFEQTNVDELVFITMIVRRHLRKYSEKVNPSLNQQFCVLHS